MCLWITTIVTQKQNRTLMVSYAQTKHKVYPALTWSDLDKRTRAAPPLGPVLSGLTPALTAAYVTDSQGSRQPTRSENPKVTQITTPMHIKSCIKIIGQQNKTSELVPVCVADCDGAGRAVSGRFTEVRLRQLEPPLLCTS